MTETNIEIPKQLAKVADAKLSLADNKIILGHFKIKSDKLSQLVGAKKNLMEQIYEEKKRIEDEFLEDIDYKTAREDEVKLKAKVKEAVVELRALVGAKYKAPGLQTIDYAVHGEQMKLQLEFAPRVYINGKELR